MKEARAIADEGVRGFLHQPADPNGAGLVLTHGAGSNCRSALLIAVSEALAESGFWVLRCDLPFRQKKPFGPPHGNGADDRLGLAAAAKQLKRLVPGPLYLGGHSYGGRQASILAVEDSEVCDGLLLLSYPLHPPKQPRNLRTSHFPQLEAAALFVHGTNDPFGSLEELGSAVELIPRRAAIEAIQNAGHDLLKGQFDIRVHVVEAFRRAMPEPRLSR